jgi:hypothetical protein
MESFNANVTELPGKAAAKPERPNLCRFSQLSASRQALVRLCQATNYGQIHHLEIRDGDPVLSPAPLILADIKLDSDEEPRSEVKLTDFVLRDEICRLMARLDELKDGTIERIEVRAGIPRRVVFEYRLTDALRWPAPAATDRDAVQSIREGR